MAAPKALTISEAAERLGVTGARIHQMLASGDLLGPPVEGARGRPGAPRVWASSIEDEVNRRERGDKRGSRPSQNDGAVQALKIALDASRDALRAQRRHTAQITDLLAQAVAALQAQERLTAQADELADGYSGALTQLLSPDDLSGLT
jgi:hypothetical protein